MTQRRVALRAVCESDSEGRLNLRSGCPPHSLAANREFVVEGLPGEILSIPGAPLPVLEVDGWCGGMTLPDMSLELSNGRTIYPRVSRTYRPDLAPVPEISTFVRWFHCIFQLEGANPRC